MRRGLASTVSALLGCTCVPSGPAPRDAGGGGDATATDGSVPLPGEFAPCTTDLRCAAGLQCLPGGGECPELPAFYSFCARPCVNDVVDCGPSPPNRCQLLEWAPGLPTNFCLPTCDDTVCPQPNPWLWGCGEMTGWCLPAIDFGPCNNLDGGSGTDAGT